MGIGLGNNGQPTYQGTPAAGNAASNPSMANSKPPPPNPSIGGKGGYGGGKGGGMNGAQALQQGQMQRDLMARQAQFAGAKPPPPNMQQMQRDYDQFRGGAMSGGIQDHLMRLQQMRGQRGMPPPGTLNTSAGTTGAPISPQAADLASGIGNLLGGDMRGTNTAADPAALPTPPAPTTTAPNPTTPPAPGPVDSMQRDMGGYRRYLGRGLGGLGKGGKGGGMRGGMPMTQGYAEGGKVSWSLPPMSGAPAGNVGAVGGTATPGTGQSMFGNLKMSGFKPMAPASAGIQKFTPMAPVAEAAETNKKFTPSLAAQFLLGMGADPKAIFGKNYDAWASQPVTNAMFYGGKKAAGRQGPR